jgi:HPt (histidine-containing phosphotransfer) domain-containing protein
MRSISSLREGGDSSSRALDVHDALSRLGGDAELLTAIIQIYLEDAPGLLHRIREAAETGDANALQRSAHSLKGLAATLSAADVTGAASRLEHMGASRNLVGAQAGADELEQVAAQLNDAVQHYLRRN